MKKLIKSVLKFFAIILVKYLQKKYKSITLKNQTKQTNQVLNTLILIQSILYYFKRQFHAWGYFHPDCIWSEKDEKEYNKLFPEKEDFKELDIVVWHNPEAVTYYHNKIYKLNKNQSLQYELEIKQQLKNWKKWN